MTEGLTATLRHAFTDLRLHRLEANVQPATRLHSPSSGGGLPLEGLSPDFLYIDGAWRDHERWAVTAPSQGSGDPHPTLPAR